MRKILMPVGAMTVLLALSVGASAASSARPVEAYPHTTRGMATNVDYYWNHHHYHHRRWDHGHWHYWD